MAPKVQFSKDQIIQAALDYSIDQGLNSLTVRKLASKLGCSVAPIYVNFKSSKELIQAVIQKIQAMAWEYSTRPYSSMGFFNIGIGQVLFARDYPELFKDLLELDPKSMAVHDDHLQRMLDVMMEDEFLKGLTRDQNSKILYMMSQFTNGLCLSIVKDWNIMSVEQSLIIMEEMAHRIICSMQDGWEHESMITPEMLEKIKQ
jgi:AcrR family transcriptional regulator